MNIKILKEGAVIPKRATEFSAGYDLSACIDQPVTVKNGEVTKVPTGIAAEIPAGYAGFIFGRSGLGIKHGVVPANAVGVIDSDYRGEIIVGLTCSFKEGYTINPGERIAQMVMMPVFTPDITVTDELSSSERGEGGFGSTGKN